MGNKVITISREFGSGGRTIGKLVAEKLRIPCYDAELIEKIAKESGFSPEYIKEEGEYASSGWLSPLLSNRSMGMTNQDKLWAIQKEIIMDLAKKGSCVIVGRCADYILKDEAECLNVFIHADMKFREERIVREYGERPETPSQRLRDKDKRRASYYRFYTDEKWGQAKNYHICLNSGVIGIENCVKIISENY